MARTKAKTVKERLDEAIAKRELLQQELNETNKTISGLQKEYVQEQLEDLKKSIEASGLTIEEALGIIEKNAVNK